MSDEWKIWLLRDGSGAASRNAITLGSVAKTERLPPPQTFHARARGEPQPI